MPRLSLPSDLGAIASTVMESLRPCVVLSPALEGTGDRGSRLAGLPQVPPGTKWPHGPDGPMSFLGQLDFRELSEAGGVRVGLPETGTLAFFYDMLRQPRGYEPGDDDGLCLVYTDALTTQIEPPLDVPVPVSEPLTAHPALSIPRPGDLRMLSWSGDPSAEPWHEAYQDFSEAFALSQGPMPPLAGCQLQVGGYADWLQGDGRLAVQLASEGISAEEQRQQVVPVDAALAGRATEWVLLWQLKPQQDLMTWMDLGTLYLLIRRHDLQHRRFDRARVIFQSV